MLINKGLSLILSLCFLPLFLSCFDKVEYGIWATIISMVNWLGFFDVGLGQGLRNRLAESIAANDYQLSREYISTTYFAISCIFIGIIVIFLVLYPFIDWYKLVNAPDSISQQINYVILIVIINTMMSFIMRQIVFILYALQKSSSVSDIGLITQVLTLTTVFIAIKVFHMSSLVFFAMIVTVIPVLVYTAYSIWLFTIKYQNLTPSVNNIKLEHINKLLGLGIFFFLIQISNIILIHSNNFIIANILGPEYVSEYHVAYQYMSVLTSFFFILTTPYWSAVTDAYSHNDKKWIIKSIKELNKYFTLTVCCAILMILSYKFIFKIWIGNKIEVRSFVVVLLAIYTLIQCYGNIYISIINGIGKIKIQFYILFSAAILYVPVVYYMTKTYSLLGLLVTMIIMAVVTNVWAPIQCRSIVNKMPNN